jgi:hypothetical protein
MNQFPTPLLQTVGTFWVIGIFMLIAGLFVQNGTYRALAMSFAGAAGCAMAIADAQYLMNARRGYGRFSGHITEESSPIGFRLHIVLQFIFVVLWGTLFVMGVRSFK